MHQTTIRFGPDLWETLEIECARLGMSAAQYIREATLARISYTAGRRQDPEFDAALEDAGVVSPDAGGDRRADSTRARIDASIAMAEERGLDRKGALAENQHALRRARQLRERAMELRAWHLELRERHRDRARVGTVR